MVVCGRSISALIVSFYKQIIASYTWSNEPFAEANTKLYGNANKFNLHASVNKKW